MENVCEPQNRIAPVAPTHTHTLRYFSGTSLNGTFPGAIGYLPGGCSVCIFQGRREKWRMRRLVIILVPGALARFRGSGQKVDYATHPLLIIVKKYLSSFSAQASPL